MRPKILALTLAAVAASLAACGDDDEMVEMIPYVDDGKLTVMTRNLYLGAELTPILSATDPTSFILATTNAWTKVRENDFPARAKRLADEIAAAQPDLVGLQEVSLWQTQTPGDAALGGITPATTVAYDYLASLLAELAARRLDYVPVKIVELVDLEAPTLVGLGPGTMDVRLTDRDVILARRGVPVTNVRGDAFSIASLGSVSVLGRPFAVSRGWAAVDTTIGGKPITFANTHLEAFDLPIPSGTGLARAAQAIELVAELASATGPVVLVGDLNATPDAAGDAHAILTGAGGGFSDAWDSVGSGEGLTCCFAEALSDAGATLDVRIDDVLLRAGTGTLTPESAIVVGEELGDRTASGLWPSDHAGVVATIAP